MNKAELNQKRLEFLEETLQYYVGHPERRNVIPEKEPGVIESCKYSPVTTNKVGISEGCAIGRHLPSETCEYFDKARPEGMTITFIFGNSTYKDKIPEEMSVLGLDFLQNIQTIHDRKSYWSNEGTLTRAGEKACNAIREFIKTEVYTSSSAQLYLTIL